MASETNRVRFARKAPYTLGLKGEVDHRYAPRLYLYIHGLGALVGLRGSIQLAQRHGTVSVALTFPTSASFPGATSIAPSKTASNWGTFDAIISAARGIHLWLASAVAIWSDARLNTAPIAFNFNGQNLMDPAREISLMHAEIFFLSFPFKLDQHCNSPPVMVAYLAVLTRRM